MTDGPTVVDVAVLDVEGARRERVTAVADRVRRVAAADREGVVFERREACEDALAVVEDVPAAGTVLGPPVASMLEDALRADSGGRGRELFHGRASTALEAVATRVLTTSLSYGVAF